MSNAPNAVVRFLPITNKKWLISGTHAHRRKREQAMNKYYKRSDGFFAFYVNTQNGEKKFSLDETDILVESDLDDFADK